MASDTESGFEKAVRSTSSDQGRRAARPVRAFSEMLVMNERKAGVATGASPELPAAAVGWVFMIGRFSCCDWEAIIKLIESMKKGLQPNFLKREKCMYGVVYLYCSDIEGEKNEGDSITKN